MEKRPRGNPNWTKGRSGNPTGKPKQERRDGWSNAASGHGTTRDRRLLTRYGVDIVTDLEAKQLWRSEWLCKRIIEVLPEQANRRGWDLKLKDGKRAEAIADRAEELDVDGAMTKAAQYERAYGGAAIYIAMDGALGDSKQPLDETKIARINAFHVLEPQELYPVAWYKDINHPKFRQPERYRIMPLATGRTGTVLIQEVHESRLVIFPGKRVSEQTQPGQREGWGDSELSHARGAIADAGMTWGSVATMLHEFGQWYLGIDGLGDMMAQSDGPEQLARRMDAWDLYGSTLRVRVGSKDDVAQRIATPLSGLDAVLVQQGVWLAAIAGMPVEILFGRAPAGLNATGDSTIRNWYADVEAAWKAHYKRRLERLVKLMLVEGTQPEPELWSIEPRPMWSPSEKEVAETRLTDAKADKIWVDIGAATPDDIAESHWKGDGYSRDIKIDWARRKKQQEEEERIALEQQKLAIEAMKQGGGEEGEGGEGGGTGRDVKPENEEPVE
jgi:phage-related protein (TIGR01555 family)